MSVSNPVELKSRSTVCNRDERDHGRDGLTDITDVISTMSENQSQSDNPTYQTLLLASTYVEDSVEGRTLPYKTDPISIDRYRRYSRPSFQWITIFFMWWNLCLAIFEDPAVPKVDLPIWGTVCMEFICLSVFAIRLITMSRFLPSGVFWKDPKNYVLVAVIIITTIDIFVYIVMNSIGFKGLRISRFLRPLFIVNMNESRQIRRAFRNIRNTIPDILSVLVLFFFSIALFALMAFKLFESRELEYRTGDDYFRNYWDSYWDLYVLVTTANSPDAMMPAYDLSRWFAIFFISYIIINTYIFMNLFLAVVYNSYRMHLEKEISQALEEKKRKLGLAFDLIKTISCGVEYITFEKWNALLGALQCHVSQEKTSVIWQVLHDDEPFKGITREKFEKAADFLNIRLVVDSADDNLFLKVCPNVFQSQFSSALVNLVGNKYFSWFFDLLIIANAFCIGFNLESTEWFFLPIFMFELGLRIYAVGPKEFFSRDKLWNWFDFFIIVAAFIVTVVEASLDELDDFPREALDVLLVLRCLRLIKIVGNIQGFRVVVVTIINITPSLLTYAGVLVMVFYTFGIIGMEVFGGKIAAESVDQINCGDEALKGSEFDRMGYCRMNFNNIANSFVTLFILMVVNQWHVITQGFVLLTNKAARLYFITFHLIVVILILNIIVAFVLEAFILEYTIRDNELEETVMNELQELRLNTERCRQMEFSRTSDQSNSCVAADDGLFSDLTYKLRVNRGHKNIEVLLQRMFEAKYCNRIQSVDVGCGDGGGIDASSSVA